MAILTEQIGDVLEAPPNSIIMRTDPSSSPRVSMLISFLDSCNTRGVWGKGIAEQLRDNVSVLAAFHLKSRAPPS